MTWVQSQLDDESLFPLKAGVPFPPKFLNATKVILKRLYRVYAHMYHSHFKGQTKGGDKAEGGSTGIIVARNQTTNQTTNSCFIFIPHPTPVFSSWVACFLFLSLCCSVVLL